MSGPAEEPNRIALSDNSDQDPAHSNMAEAQGTTEKETQDQKGGAGSGEQGMSRSQDAVHGSS